MRLPEPQSDAACSWRAGRRKTVSQPAVPRSPARFDKPLRLINLRQTGALLAIDQEGYSSAPLPGLLNPDDVTIPALTGVRQKFVFEGPSAEVTSIRLWGRDFEVKK